MWRWLTKTYYTLFILKIKITYMKLNTVLLVSLPLFILASCGKSEKTDNAQIEADISPISAKVNSYVAKVLVADNQAVKEGDTLLLLDDAAYKIAVLQAEVALEQANQAVELAKSNKQVVGSTVEGATANSKAVANNLAAAQAGVAAAKVKLTIAAKNYTRFENLLAEKSVTQQQFDFAKAEKDGAEQGVQIAEAQLASLQQQIEASKAQVNTSKASVTPTVNGIALAAIGVRQAENALAAARLQLSYCVVTAPSDGVVSKKTVQKGQSVAIGQPLLAVTNNTKMWVVANYKETQIANIKEGADAIIQVDAFGSEEFKGKVSSFAQATGAKFSLLPPDNATGNFVKVTQRIPVKIEFAQPIPSQFPLRAGMSVSVKIINP
ncbi:MAG: HlyD family secretion protein [Bacteroidetes bacterium]|nr:MAG: HlyD family secretion protein [Bacteroidota bacterium]TAF90819.1 MAG: HlyD family secretion protein [Bacteroidota bacterium]